MAHNLYFYISESNDPYENIATEKFLFDTLSENDISLYLWQNKDTVVIGKNQNPAAECRISVFEEEGIKLARRLSGGGCVFHDMGNLNFTFLCSEENYSPEKQTEIIMNACSMAGIRTEFSGRNDILAEGRKFSGNAFYISKGKVCRHGTLMIDTDTERLTRLLTPSKAKLQSKGIKSVKSRVINLSELSSELTTEKMKEYMLGAFGCCYGKTPCPIKEVDKKRIDILAGELSSWEYLYGKTLPFSASFEAHFLWGSAQLNLDVRHAVIENAVFYTDSMDETLSEKISSALIGCRYNAGCVKASLFSALPAEISGDIFSLFKEVFPD